MRWLEHVNGMGQSKQQACLDAKVIIISIFPEEMLGGGLPALEPATRIKGTDELCHASLLMREGMPTGTSIQSCDAGDGVCKA
jgi:hypothetical protein